MFGRSILLTLGLKKIFTDLYAKV